MLFLFLLQPSCSSYLSFSIFVAIRKGQLFTAKTKSSWICYWKEHPHWMNCKLNIYFNLQQQEWLAQLSIQATYTEGPIFPAKFWQPKLPVPGLNPFTLLNQYKSSCYLNSIHKSIFLLQVINLLDYGGLAVTSRLVLRDS